MSSKVGDANVALILHRLKKVVIDQLGNYSKETFVPDPNLNTGSEILIPDADSTSHQTVPKN